MSHSDEKKSETSVQVHEATEDIYSSDEIPGLDRVYHAKARLLNNAIQEIGMGKYQVRSQLYLPRIFTNPSKWWLFVVTGFGWFADNLWPVSGRYPTHTNGADAL